MAEYIDRERLLEIINSNVALEHNQRCCQLLGAILNAPAADVEEVRHGKWMLEVKKGSCYDYHVTAHCSKCGWEWIGKDSECVGNNKYVFAAFIQGNKEIAEQFALDNAKQRHLYDYCPNCYAKMDLGDDES